MEFERQALATAAGPLFVESSHFSTNDWLLNTDDSSLIAAWTEKKWKNDSAFDVV